MSNLSPSSRLISKPPHVSLLSYVFMLAKMLNFYFIVPVRTNGSSYFYPFYNLILVAVAVAHMKTALLLLLVLAVGYQRPNGGRIS
jgi:hypothetical protein